MSTLLTDMRRSGRREEFLPFFVEADGMNMDGSKNTSSHQVNYSGDSSQDDIRNKMALSHHNLTVHKNIEDLVPASVCPNGMMHTLLTNAPTTIRLCCNFIKTDKDEKSFFDVDCVYDDKSKVLSHRDPCPKYQSNQSKLTLNLKTATTSGPRIGSIKHSNQCI